jgi:hypothetical protein
MLANRLPYPLRVSGMLNDPARWYSSFHIANQDPKRKTYPAKRKAVLGRYEHIQAENTIRSDGSPFIIRLKNGE